MSSGNNEIAILADQKAHLYLSEASEVIILKYISLDCSLRRGEKEEKVSGCELRPDSGVDAILIEIQ